MSRFKNTYTQIKEISLALAYVDFKLRNEGKWLGVLWYLLAPLLTFIFLFEIFQDRLGMDIPHYPLYLLLGIIIFNFFRNVTQECVSVIKKSDGIIKSINFPREALVVGVVLKTLLSHVFEIVVLLFFIAYFGIPLWVMLWYPLVLGVLVLFTFGVSLIVSAVGVYFFDLENIWMFGLNLVWFITPIFYAIGGQGKLFLLNMFNPLFFIISFARDLIIYSRVPEWYITFGAVGYTIVVLFVGLFVFNRVKHTFAELI